MSNLICVLVLFASLVGCASNQPANTFVGVYADGFEASEFYPCKNDEIWWLEAARENSDEFYAQLETVFDSYRAKHGEDSFGYGKPYVYLRVQAAVSEFGKYGHMGRYSRELVVSRALSMREAYPSEVSRCVSGEYLDDYDWSDILDVHGKEQLRQKLE